MIEIENEVEIEVMIEMENDNAAEEVQCPFDKPSRHTSSDIWPCFLSPLSYEGDCRPVDGTKKAKCLEEICLSLKITNFHHSHLQLKILFSRRSSSVCSH